MSKHAGCKRGFTQLSNSWFGRACLAGSKDIVDEFMVGMYHPDGGTSGEFSFTWEVLMGDISIKMQAYNDSWSALSQFSDLLDKMSEIDDQNISPKEFAELLTTLGIEDMTERGYD